MDFNLLVKNKLQGILEFYGFVIIDETVDYLEYESLKVALVISYDNIENVGYLYVGKKGLDLLCITSDIFKLFFNDNPKNYFFLPQKSIEDFVNNLKLFFLKDGKPLLQSDDKLLNDLENYNLLKSHRYTNNIRMRQNINKVDSDWTMENYEKFIEHVNEIGISNLPHSYKLKYDIALKNAKKKSP